MRDVDGDGNCLFRSVSDQIEGEESNHRYYRDLAITHMTKNKDFFKLFLSEKEDFDKYIKEMDEDGTWGGHFELVALSAALNINFILHMKDKDPYVITAGMKYDKKIRTYHLAYHIDEHYSSVRKLGDDGNNPAEQIELDFKFVVEEESDSGESDSSSNNNINNGEEEKVEDEMIPQFEVIDEQIDQGEQDFYTIIENKLIDGEDLLKSSQNQDKGEESKQIQNQISQPKEIDIIEELKQNVSNKLKINSSTNNDLNNVNNIENGVQDADTLLALKLQEELLQQEAQIQVDSQLAKQLQKKMNTLDQQIEDKKLEKASEILTKNKKKESEDIIQEFDPNFLKQQQEIMEQFEIKKQEKQIDNILEQLKTKDNTTKQQPAKKIKVSNNDPCPCGSGVKFKKCQCGEFQKQHQTFVV